MEPMRHGPVGEREDQDLAQMNSRERYHGGAGDGTIRLNDRSIDTSEGVSMKQETPRRDAGEKNPCGGEGHVGRGEREVVN